MRLYWLRNTKPCTIELPLVDYAGQRLVFQHPGKPLSRRCVREDVYRSEHVQSRLRTQILEVEDGDTSVPAAPTLPDATEPEPTPAPELSPEPMPEPEPEPESEPDMDSEEDGELTEETDTVSDSSSLLSSSGKRRKRKRNS